MAYQGEKYVGDLALYYIAKKLESGQKTGSVKGVITDKGIYRQLWETRMNYINTNYNHYNLMAYCKPTTLEFFTDTLDYDKTTGEDAISNPTKPS